jgi:hypothetical protein
MNNALFRILFEILALSIQGVIAIQVPQVPLLIQVAVLDLRCTLAVLQIECADTCCVVVQA